MLARVNPFISHPDGTVADMLGSLDRLAEVTDDGWILLPGHGPCVREPRTYIRRRIADRHRRIDQVAGLIDSGVPRDELTDLLHPDLGEGRRRAASASVEAILHYLDSRVRPGERGGRP